ncbi:hypothetical protein KDJ56_09370 [Brevibacillus composti]|uniref:Uncharacterized protein n=1 Tax=Brevibacillus composti TaxID=2796470 RepID=A0A7T5EP02_9BACL|nr:hypothetical protein [Brevibacillus composti]QQE76101.1 hypothetical protein JD108_09675 [Brevibacillus composti]QUO43130.1 hypothetical protein KDJ56_09370 [Brevibacillus composti]
MTLIWIFLLLLFILIGIFKDKNGEYLKRSSIAFIVLSNIAAISIAFISSNRGGAVQVGWIYVEDLPFYFLVSVHGVILGLLLYLFASGRLRE